MMSSQTSLWNKIAMIGTLAEQAPEERLNRTALIKYMYLLQTLRQIPLGYNFTLYSYGPHDNELPDDIDYAETLGIVQSELVEHNSGYEYIIRPSSKIDLAKEHASEFLSKYKEDVKWVLREFANFKSADLELASIIIYVDQEMPKNFQTLKELANKVRGIKPLFTVDRILELVEYLQKTGLLTSVLVEDLVYC